MFAAGDGLLHKTTDEQWDAMLRVHNTAPFRLIRAGMLTLSSAHCELMCRDGSGLRACSGALLP